MATRMPPPSAVPFSAIRRRPGPASPGVRARKIGTSPTGSIVTRKATSASDAVSSTLAAPPSPLPGLIARARGLRNRGAGAYRDPLLVEIALTRAGRAARAKREKVGMPLPTWEGGGIDGWIIFDGPAGAGPGGGGGGRDPRGGGPPGGGRAREPPPRGAPRPPGGGPRGDAGGRRGGGRG